MKKIFALVACLGMLSAVACGPSEEERRKQDSASEKTQDSMADEMFDDAMKMMNDMDSTKDTAKKDSPAKK